MALLVATTLVPVIVGSGFFFPYVVPRNLYFRTIVEIGTAILALVLCYGRNKLDLRGEPVFYAFAAFLAAAILSAAFSPARMHSFFGDFERMGGVWAWLNLVLFFLLLRTMRDGDWPWVLNSALAVSLFVSVQTIVEHGRLESLASAPDSFVSPPISAIGNSGLLGAYLLIGIAIAGYLACTSVRFRLLYLLAGGAHLLALLYAQNRSSVIGLVLGAVTAAIIFATVSTKSRKKWIAPCAAAALALIVFGGSAWIRAFPTGSAARTLPTVLQRIALTNLGGPDESRTMQWRAAIDAFTERPVLGYGPENHNLVWSAHFDPDIVRTDTDIFDRTHNQFLEVLATMGIVGIAAFLGIWVAIGLTLIRAYRAGRISAAQSAVLWGIQIAYATYLVFWFVDLNSTMLWIMLAALIASRGTVGPVVLEATGTDPQPALTRPSLAFASVFVLIAALYTEGYNPLVADRALARVDSPDGNVADALRDLDLLTRSTVHQTAHTPLVMAEYIGSLRPRLPEMRADPRERKMMDRAFNESFGAFASEIHRDTLNDRLYTHEAALLMEAAQFYESSIYRQQAIDAFHKAIDLSPHRAEQRLGLANLYMTDRDYERALVVLNDAVKSDPQLGELRFRLAQAYIGAGKSDSALAMLQTSLRLGYVGAPETYLAMGKRLEFSGRSGTAAALYSDYLEAKYTEAIWDRSETIERTVPTTDLAVAAHLPLLYMRARESELAVKSAAALSAFDPSRTPIVDRFVSDVGTHRRANWVAKSSLLPCATARNARSRDSTAFSACGVFRKKL
jgi:O-antigen ligase/tetratricopeptide (TPR) repeat protein